MTLTQREKELSEIKALTRRLHLADEDALARVREARGQPTRHRQPIAFVHIPKTGGATAAGMLATAFSRAAMHDAGNFVKNPETAAKKLGRIANRDSRRRGVVRVAAGHTPYGMFREYLPAADYITMMRDPVDRVLSQYHRHIRRTGTAQDQRKEDKGKILAYSVEEALAKRPLELENLATRFLCGQRSPTGELPATAVDDAKANLRQFEFVGIQERFEESMVLLQRTLGLDLVPYVNRHVGIDRPADDEVSDQQRALIAERNQLDTELYAFANELFDEAVAAADDGFAADVETLRRLSAAANDEAIRNARELLDRELPPGSTRPDAEVFSAADRAGVSRAALDHVFRLVSVEREFGGDGRRSFARPAEGAERAS